MANYALNDRAMAHAYKLIEGRQYVLRSDWGDTQPDAQDENRFLLAVPGMRPGASIINTASIQAVHPSANLLAYATTKGGIVTFSKALAAQLAERGIRVNVVAPGPVWTPLVELRRLRGTAQRCCGKPGPPLRVDMSTAYRRADDHGRFRSSAGSLCRTAFQRRP